MAEDVQTGSGALSFCEKQKIPADVNGRRSGIVAARYRNLAVGGSTESILQQLESTTTRFSAITDINSEIRQESCEERRWPRLLLTAVCVLQVVDCSWDETVKIYTPPCLSAATL